MNNPYAIVAIAQGISYVKPMQLTNKTPSSFWRTGIVLVALSLFVFLIGLGPTHMGYWGTQEPRLVLIFLLAVFHCLWLWKGFFKGWIQVNRQLPPLLLLVAAWLGWQLVVMFVAATSTWQTWFGPPDYGEGVGWYVCLTLLTLQAYLLWQHPHYRRVLFRVAIAAAVLMYCLQIPMQNYGYWRVNAWGDYFPWIIGWLWITAHFLYPDLSVRDQFRLGLGLWLAMVLAGSDAGTLFFCCALLVSQGAAELAVWRGREHMPVPGWLRTVACVACLLPLVYTFGSYFSPRFFDEYQGSISLRVHMNGEATRALLDEPERLFFGKGWDSFQNVHVEQSIYGNVNFFEKGKLDPNLSSLFGGAVHSHNQPLEALLSHGVIGLALWFAFSFYVFLKIPARFFWRIAPLQFALVLTSYFWFYMSFIYAFLALYWAALMVVCTHQKSAEKIKPETIQWAALAVIPLAFVMLWSAAAQFRAMAYSEWLVRVLGSPYQNYPMEVILEDAERGGERLRHITADLLSSVTLQVAYDARPFEKRRQWNRPNVARDSHLWIEKLLDASYLMSADPRVGPYVGSTDLMLQFFLQTPQSTEERFNKARAYSFQIYPATVLRAARQYPKRDDLSMPFFYHLDHSDEPEDRQTLSIALARVLDANPKHRIALWLMGKQLIKHPESEAQGHELMREAIEAGVRNIYPISDAEVKAVR